MVDITNDFTVTDVDLLQAAKSAADPIEIYTIAHQDVLKQELLFLLREKYKILMASEAASVFLDVLHTMQRDEERMIENLKNLT